MNWATWLILNFCKIISVPLINIHVIFCSVRDFNSNTLSYPIPSSLGNLVKVNWIALVENQLIGTLPVSNASQPGLDRLVAAQHL